MDSFLPDILQKETKDELLCCTICHGQLNQPKLLPCLHTFCQDCLESCVYFEDTSNDVISEQPSHLKCPLCDNIVELSENGLDEIPDNIFLIALQNPDNDPPSRDTSPELCMVVPQKCNNCESDIAVYTCRECGHNLCRFCRRAHDSLKITRSHKVVSLHGREAKRTSVRKTYGDETRANQDSACWEHPDEIINMCCVQCDQPICAKCRATDHTIHRCVPLQDTAKRDRDFIKSSRDFISSKVVAYQDAIINITKYESDIQDSKEHLLKEINSRNQKMHQMIDACSQTLIEQLDSCCSREQSQIETYKETYESQLASLRATEAFIDRLVKQGKPDEVVHMKRYILERNPYFEDHCNPEKINRKLSLKFSHIHITQNDLQKFSGRIIETKIAVPKVVIQPKSPLPSPLSPMGSTLKSEQVSNFTSKTSNDKMGCKPTSITVTETDEIIVIDDINKKIKIFNKRGRLINEIVPEGPQKLIDPWDVCVLKNEHIAVTDRAHGVCGIKVFSMDGEFVKTLCPHLKSPWGITTNSKGEIITTDIEENCVKVHDPEGGLLYSIPEPGEDQIFMCPEYVCINNNDDIIVSDFEGHFIKVFDSQGRFLYQYGSWGFLPQQFDVPCGLSTNQNGDILIADYNNHRIHIITTDGKFKGYVLTAEDGIRQPQDVAINSEGELVVADGKNIKVFNYYEGPMTSDSMEYDQPIRTYDTPGPTKRPVTLEKPPVPSKSHLVTTPQSTATHLLETGL